MPSVKARVSLLWLAPAVLAAASPPADWKAGVARAAITPSVPIPLAGYAGRTHPFTGVDHDLYAKAPAIEDSAGNRALLVTADVLVFSNHLGVATLERRANSTESVG